MKKYIISTLLYLIIPAIVICLFPDKARAQYHYAPLYYEGGSDAFLYNNDTIMLENTVLDDASGIKPAGTLTFQTTYMYSQYYMPLYMGINYSLADFCEIDFTLPYVFRTLEYNGSDYHKRGYGDTKLGLTFFFNILKIIDSTTSLKMTFPTGDPMAKDGSYIVPTGYGSFIYSLLESVSYKLPKSISTLPFRFFGNFGFNYYSQAILESSSSTKIRIEDGMAVMFLLGTEYSFFDFLAAQIKFNIVHLPGSNYRIQTTGVGSTDWTERNDKMTASDFIIAAKFKIKDYVSGYLSFIIPMIESKSDAAPEDARRKWKILLNLNKEF